MEKDIIYSKSFKSWFGDWENDPEHSSKMVDKEGRPLICYHGSHAKFSEFEDKYHWNDSGYFGKGFYFTFSNYGELSKEEARFYGPIIYECYLNIRNPFDFSQLYLRNGERGDVYLALYNLYLTFPELNSYIKIDCDGKEIGLKEYRKLYEDIESKMYIDKTADGKYIWRLKREDLGEDGEDYYGWVQYDTEEEAKKEELFWLETFLRKYAGVYLYKFSYYILQASDIFSELIKRKGYDGIVQSRQGDEAVVFNSNQIKSAINNSGNFSKESDNIYEKILHKNNKWIVTDHTGKKNLGTYDTKEEAEKRLKQVEYFKHKNESNKTMNNYTQFFDKYTERTISINNVAYQANLVNAVTSYLKNNGYQVTNNDIASGCKALIKNFGKNSTGISSNYGKNNTDTSRVNNVLAGVFPPKQNTVPKEEQQAQTNPQGAENTNPQNTDNQDQNPQGNSGTNNPEDSKDTPPEDNSMNDLAGITMLTKSELNAMVNQKIFSNAVSKVINKTKKDEKSSLKVYYMGIVGSDNVYDDTKETTNKRNFQKNKGQKK